MKIKLFCLLAVILLAAFYGTGLVLAQEEAKQEDLAAKLKPYTGFGLAVVKGVVWFQDLNGIKANAVDLPLYLYPDLPEVKEYFDQQRYYQTSGQTAAKLDERILQVRREVKTDKEGNFDFTRVPAGNWLVAGEYILPESKDESIKRIFFQAIEVKTAARVTVNINIYGYQDNPILE